jgi:hypothetical protein
MHWSNQSNVLKIKVKIIGPEDFLGLIIGIFINPFLYVSLGYIVYKLIALKKGLTPMELIRRIMKGSSRATRKTYSISVTKKISLLDVATKYLPSIVLCSFLFSVPDQAHAGFEIIDNKKPVQTLVTPNTNVPFSESKSGFGNDVRLEDVISILINKPWQFDFISKEIKALKVSWLSRGSTVSEIIAQLGRNYGIETYYVESAGEIHLDWSSGFCSAKIEEERVRRNKFNEEILFGAKDNSFPSVFKVVRDERVYLC